MRAPRDAGFTLVEALASLAVLAALSLMMLAGLSSSRQAWARMGAAQQQVDEVEAAQLVLRDRLERLRAVPRFTPPGPEFEGSPDSIEFMGPAAASAGLGAVRRYRLDLGADGTLGLAWVNDRALDTTQWAARDRLMQGVEALSVEYYGAPTAGGPRGWQDRWFQVATLPDAIKVRVDFPTGDRRVWPALVLRPAATIDSDCVLDIVAAGCRGR